MLKNKNHWYVYASKANMWCGCLEPPLRDQDIGSFCLTGNIKKLFVKFVYRHKERETWIHKFSASLFFLYITSSQGVVLLPMMHEMQAIALELFSLRVQQEFVLSDDFLVVVKMLPAHCSLVSKKRKHSLKMVDSEAKFHNPRRLHISLSPGLSGRYFPDGCCRFCFSTIVVSRCINMEQEFFITLKLDRHTPILCLLCTPSINPLH